MSTGRTHLLGIRHHGPGSAASVLAALDSADPAIVLIEGPADAGHVLSFAASAGMRPPVAILVHDAGDPAQAMFFPFADYSPEWQALRWALARNRPVRFIDLPAGHRFAPAGEGGSEDTMPDGDSSPLRHDPLSALAEAAGESDGETWWNSMVEQSAGGKDVFAAVAHAMTALRSESEKDHPLSPREAQREAHMRLAIGKALAETDGAVAVICGAWHVPALARAVPAKQDRETLKGMKPAKTLATWIPWTDSRLAAASGYGAGVVSPGWYRHLWAEFHSAGGSRPPAEVTARWQASVAGLLRTEGQITSTAAVIEASRLAMALAALRGYPMPGLAEMQDASLSVMCHGSPLLLDLIASRLVTGDAIGETGDDVPLMPLAEDLQRWQKKLRLKPSAAQEDISVDLRSETGLLKSELLHRLLLISVPWGRLADAQAGRGTFRESWVLAWEPELSVKLAEAVRFGTTIEQAAANAALEDGGTAASLSRCAELISLCLKANLADAAERLTRRLQALSAGTADIEELLRAAPPIIGILRYGTARKLPRPALLDLVTGLCAEIVAGIGMASRGLDEQAAALLLQAMRSFDAAVPLLDNDDRLAAWHDALAGIERDESAVPPLRGFALRRLYDAGRCNEEQTATRLSRALSPAVPTLAAGQWMEGFLNQSAQLLLHDEKLFGLIDDWLTSVDESAFIELLPALRRAVGSFDTMERRNLLEKVRSGRRAGEAAPPHAAPALSPAFETALPLLKTILGIDS